MSKSPLLVKVRDPMWVHHYSLRTEEDYEIASLRSQ